MKTIQRLAFRVEVGDKLLLLPPPLMLPDGNRRAMEVTGIYRFNGRYHFKLNGSDALEVVAEPYDTLEAVE